jgi:N6-adenosine-specific RNA methylase IME4
VKRYRAILIDPPWPLQTITGFTHPRNRRPDKLPYPTMTVAEIGKLPVADLADTNAHVWLWTTNRFLPDGFDLLKLWGFKYMVPVHWVKPSGLGAWWVHRTQTLLFGYRGKLDMKAKLKPNIIEASPKRHSQKPTEAYELVEQISHPDRLELFARNARDGWDSVGNAIDGKDIFDALEGLKGD